jgi:hypothetical protein
MNQNYLKHLFYRFIVTVQKFEMFQTDSPLKRFDFFLFETALSDSSLILKHFTLSNETLMQFYLPYNIFKSQSISTRFS